jgi:hypothetical protein
VSFMERVVGIREKEESILLKARFEPLEEDDGVLWEKDGVYYCREAALQYALRELRERAGVYLFDRS